MKIQWLGHSCFLLETSQGTKIITDPYEPGSYGGAIGYGEIKEIPDIVTVSHKHFDHAYTKGFSNAKIIESLGLHKVKDIEIEGLPSYHDENKGAQRGENIIFIFRADGISVAHFGDLGHIPYELEKLNNLNVILLPVGGTFTIGWQEATQLVSFITPNITIPMHYKTKKLGFDIDGVDKFIKGKPNVEVKKESFIEINKDNLPVEPKIIVLKHAL